MRILHTSDWHLGRTFHGRVLDDAQAVFAEHLIEVVKAEGVDAVVISGDVYDRAIPPTAAVRLLDDTLCRLAECTRVVLTPGNHDSAQRLGFAATLLREGLDLRVRVADVDSPVIIPDAAGHPGLYIYALPYLDPDAARESLPPLLAARLGEGIVEPEAQADAASPADPAAFPGPPDAAAPVPAGGPALLPRSHEAVVSAALRLVSRDLASRRAADTVRVPALAMAHAFVVGGQASPDSERDIRVGGVDSVPAGVFTTLGGSPLADASGGLDYVALGHLHRPQELHSPAAGGDTATASAPAADAHPFAAHAPARPRLVYSGSPLPFSFPEADVTKSSVLLELGPTGVTRMERIPTPTPYRATTLRGTLDQLLAPANAIYTRDWVRVELTGPMPPGTMAQLKERFPNLLAFSQTRPEQPDRETITVTRASDPVDVADRFLTEMLGHRPTPAQHAIMAAAYDAARAETQLKEDR
ncbi:exonuclease SbcCD subunit D [Actinomyces sp. 565]|uniref:exonuclease SbcCD subunit D n=1 Tax=Actinomyces sp. 565 TaxID=2057794 RepID=UPI0013A6A66D|nr:exonuclease SbcCD subunit D [Actinomyces sp. 565]NDR52559.1 exonuclease SbcCD subunit D [Actinomyces sp. 565]